LMVKKCLFKFVLKKQCFVFFSKFNCLFLKICEVVDFVLNKIPFIGTEN